MQLFSISKSGENFQNVNFSFQQVDLEMSKFPEGLRKEPKIKEIAPTVWHWLCTARFAVKAYRSVSNCPFPPFLIKRCEKSFLSCYPQKLSNNFLN